MFEELSQKPESVLPRRFFFISAIIYICVFAYYVWQGVFSPLLNWDMVAYVGSAISWEENDPQAVYDRTMEEIKKAVPLHYYIKISEEISLSKDAAVFNQQLPFYNVKPLYIGAIKLLHGMGAGLAQATWLVSTLSFGLLGITLACWRPALANRGIWLLSVCALCILGIWSMGHIARLSTPDTLSMTLFALAFVTWSNFRLIAPYAACVILSIFARPDSLLNFFYLTLYFTYLLPGEQRIKPVWSIAIMLLACVVYLAVQNLAGAYSWQTLFYYSFINKIPDIGNANAMLTLDQYIGVVRWGLSLQMENARLQFFAALSLVALIMHYLRPGGQRQWLWLMLVAWAAYAARFAFFPAWGDDRYYYPYYILILMASLELMAPLTATLWKSIQQCRE